MHSELCRNGKWFISTKKMTSNVPTLLCHSMNNI